VLLGVRKRDIALMCWKCSQIEINRSTRFPFSHCIYVLPSGEHTLRPCVYNWMSKNIWSADDHFVYVRSVVLEQDRRRNLEDAIIYFRFTRECDNFESWMDDKVCRYFYRLIIFLSACDADESISAVIWWLWTSCQLSMWALECGCSFGGVVTTLIT